MLGRMSAALRPIALSTLVLLAAAPSVADPVPEPPGLLPGASLPEAVLAAELADLEGTPTPFGDLVGENGTLVVFAANSCPWVLDWLDRFPAFAATAQEHGVGFVVVNSNERRRSSDDAPEAMARLWDERALEVPYLVDRDAALADALGAERTPEVFLFDADRQLVYRGAIDDHSGPLGEVERHWTRDALSRMVGGLPVELPLTTTPGCRIQRPRRR